MRWIAVSFIVACALPEESEGLDADDKMRSHLAGPLEEEVLPLEFCCLCTDSDGVGGPDGGAGCTVYDENGNPVQFGDGMHFVAESASECAGTELSTVDMSECDD